MKINLTIIDSEIIEKIQQKYITEFKIFEFGVWLD